MRAPSRPATGRRILLRGLVPAAAGAWTLGLIGPERDPLQVALVIAFLVLSLALHEVAHGWTALKRGDPTARDLGRLSLNPIVHIDPIWTLLIPLVTYTTSGFIFGGARPVPVDYYRLRHPRRDMALVAAAGPLTNLLLALVFMLALKASMSVGSYESTDLLPRVMWASVYFNVLLFIFNLIPIPPLDGSRILAWLLPNELRPAYVRLERFGMLAIVMLLLFVPSFQAFVLGGIERTIDLLDLVTVRQW